ncbi:MAG: CD225/dispanin family protein [Bacteroidales bacterium]|nr:CD225/dispanin family protein [Bacteroidales bacterium]
MKIVKIGRSSHNDVVINDDFVSSSHCQIIQDDRGNCTLIDTNSSNGTYVNGVRRQGEVHLSPSDMVRIGHTNLPWQNYFDSPVRNGMQRPQGGGQNYANKPDNFLAPAILCTIFLSLAFGIVSIVFASKVNKQWEAGDYDGAIESARKARTWFWVGLGVGLFRILVFLAMQ